MRQGRPTAAGHPCVCAGPCWASQCPGAVHSSCSLFQTQKPAPEKLSNEPKVTKLICGRARGPIRPSLLSGRPQIDFCLQVSVARQPTGYPALTRVPRPCAGRPPCRRGQGGRLGGQPLWPPVCGKCLIQTQMEGTMGSLPSHVLSNLYQGSGQEQTLESARCTECCVTVSKWLHFSGPQFPWMPSLALAKSKGKVQGVWEVLGVQVLLT